MNRSTRMCLTKITGVFVHACTVSRRALIRQHMWKQPCGWTMGVEGLHQQLCHIYLQSNLGFIVLDFTHWYHHSHWVCIPLFILRCRATSFQLVFLLCPLAEWETAAVQTRYLYPFIYCKIIEPFFKFSSVVFPTVSASVGKINTGGSKWHFSQASFGISIANTACVITCLRRCMSTVT